MEIETNNAVSSILPPPQLDNERKRKVDEIEDSSDNQINSGNKATQDTKKPFIKRYYNELNKGPFQIIIQSKERKRINPFLVGKILQNHHNDIEFIDRAGNNLTVTCNNATAANNLVDSVDLHGTSPKTVLFL